ncbi:MAG: long-chain acyl-CoA synthetase [Desulforhopalus sp.]|jgi:long-chain acyl-CoA synthetase
MTKSSIDYISPQSCTSLSELFQERIIRSPQRVAYQYFAKTEQLWKRVTWREMFELLCQWRAALIQENLTQGDRVAVMLPNSIFWVVFEQAALSLGLIVVPLYSNDRPENIAYILRDTESKILTCPGNAYFDQLAPTLKDVPSLQRIITIDDCRIQEPDPVLICVDDWLPDKNESIMKEFTPVTTETATIVYTSGTTGAPKGVMLSHSNILSNSYAGLLAMDIYLEDSFLSFLPLSHMLERTAGYYLPMMAGASISFARSIPDLAEDLVTIKPTVMVAVPRIFEKMYSAIGSKVATGTKLKAQLFEKAIDVGWKHFLYKQHRQPWEVALLLHPVLDRLVGQKVREKLGGKLRIIIAGGAALSTDISKFFIGLGLPIYQGYGLTETSPVVAVNRLEDNRPGGVGRPLADIEIKIGDHDELLVKGPCVMQGYWNNQQATDEIIDSDGWLHTGDKVVIEDGHIRITGRIKDIIVLSNGEKVAPADMEMAISLDPLFEHIMVIGEGRPYLTLICVLNQFPWEELAEQLGVTSASTSLILPKVKHAVRSRINKHLIGFPGFVFIKKVTLSLAPWSVEGGLMTPTLKIKRKAIETHMSKQINTMYNDKL